jgi:glycosyltransferase involved in cell wall biosynthesis
MKILILISSEYPYGFGETFLETEIKYTDKYDKIFIYPVNYNGKGESRISRDNIEIVANNKKDNKFSMFFKLFPMLINIEVIKEFWLLLKSKKLKFSNMKKTLSFYYYGSTAYKKFYKTMKKKINIKNDSITIYSYWLDYHSMIAVKLSKKLNSQNVISRGHRYDIYEYVNADGYLPFRNYLYKNLTQIHTISNDGFEYLRNKYPIYSNKIELSRLGTIDYGLAPVDSTRRTIKIVTCSWISKVKRLNLIIDTLLTIDNFYIEWTHFGNGPQVDYINNYLKKLVIKDNIKVNFKGHTKQKELMDYYKNNCYDIFVNVSESEGLPVSIMEAMSFGVPVIATNVGGTSDIVIDNFNGFLLDPNNVINELSDKIKHIAKMSQKEYNNFRKNARKVWLDNFSADANYKEFYNKVEKINE